MQPEKLAEKIREGKDQTQNDLIESFRTWADGRGLSPIHKEKAVQYIWQILKGEKIQIDKPTPVERIGGEEEQ